MPRPLKHRRLQHTAQPAVYKPVGVPLQTIACVTLLQEELEALRLADVEEHYQLDAARQMAVSRSTFQRILRHARLQVATALVEGLALEIQGSTVATTGVRWHCDTCGHNWQIAHGSGAGEPERCPACGSRTIGSRRPKRRRAHR